MVNNKNGKKWDGEDGTSDDGETSGDGEDSDIMSEDGDSGDEEAPSGVFKRNLNLRSRKRQSFAAGRCTNEDKILLSSVFRFNLAIQILVYVIAAGGVLFVLIAPSFEWGKPAHRRLSVNYDYDDLEQVAGRYKSVNYDDLVQVAGRYWYDLDGKYVHEDHSWADRRALSTDETGNSSTGHGNTSGNNSAGGGGHGSTNPGTLPGSNPGHGSAGHGSAVNVNAGGGHQLVINIAYCTVSAGFIAIWSTCWVNRCSWATSSVACLWGPSFLG